MSVPIVAFFNNKGGVGKTTLVYHLAWMFSDLNVNVVAADLDPQGNLTTAFLDEDRLERLWLGSALRRTIYGGLQPLVEGTGDIGEPHLEEIGDCLALLPGDLELSSFEDDLSLQWIDCLSGKQRAFRFLSAFWRLMQKAAERRSADLILMDLGPNLGAINRAALIAADSVVVPLAPDLFSLQGLRNLGPAFRQWRQDWRDRLVRRPAGDFEVPEGKMTPIGYIVMQHSERLSRPVQAYRKWADRIPAEYHRSVLGESPPTITSIPEDPENLALLKHYRSLMPMGQEARKPIFHLKAADGAIGAHTAAVRDACRDFKQLATTIAGRIGLNPERADHQAMLPLQ